MNQRGRIRDFLNDDPTGAGRFKSWVANLRAAEGGAPLVTRVQQLVHPGVEPLAGEGFFGAKPKGRHRTPGQGPLSVSTLYWFDGPTPENEFTMDSRDSAFGALLTLVTNRRCYVAPEVPITVEGDSKALLIPVAPSLDPSLNAPMPAWEDVEREARQNLARIASLRDEDAATISAAMHMHYCAALLASQDIAGAHAIAVGGLETLASTSVHRHRTGESGTRRKVGTPSSKRTASAHSKAMPCAPA